MRSSALIAVCSAFEYLIKARFVDAAIADQESATKQLSAKRLNVKLDLIEVLGLPANEQWFAIADELFKKAGDGGKPMSDRVRLMLFDYVDMHPVERDQREMEFEQQLSAAPLERFNLAFLVRHCFVHNGGRANRALSRATTQPTGHEIVLTDPEFLGLVGAVRKVAESASPYFLLSLK